jgi:hypothetical protein
MGPRKFLNLVFAWCLKQIPVEERRDWEENLSAPLEGQGHREPTQRELETEAEGFLALMQRTGG